MFVGCGSNHSKSRHINGDWTAALTNSSDGSQAFTFTTSITENNDGTLSVASLTISASSCFVSGETESGSFALGGNFNGNVTGQFQFKVMSASPSNNVLTLTGTANGNTIKGTWTLTGGTGCQGSGNFTMTRGRTELREGIN